MPGVAFKGSKNCYQPTVLGIGFIGNGKYSRSATPVHYNIWYAMMRRCYSKYAQSRQQGKSYKGCTVVKRWHNLQNFCEDLIKMDNWGTKGFSLDKDGRKLGNRVYGPKYCSFVPDHVNNLLNSMDYVGVTLHKGYYIARISKWGKLRTIAQFKTYKQAAKAYTVEKIKYLKEAAKYYRDCLHIEVYRTLIKGLPCPE